MKKLQGKVALVTGASRGVGKGIALGLGEAGATVYITGRTVEPGTGVQGLSGSIQETAAEVDRLGGKGAALQCDHTKDADVADVFRRLQQEAGRLDIIVNNVWGGYETMFTGQGEYVWQFPFWKQPILQWDAMFSAGVRACYVASHHAARMMTSQRSGIIVNISHWAGQKYSGNVCYGVSKAATDRLTMDMAHELRTYNVSVISLYPGLVRTERVLRAAEFFDLSNSESPQFLGGVVSALAEDENILGTSGKIHVAARLAIEYGIIDIDGRQPRPRTLEEA